MGRVEEGERGCRCWALGENCTRRTVSEGDCVVNFGQVPGRGEVGDCEFAWAAG